MSTTRYSDNGVTISTYTGPEEAAAEPPYTRRMVQIDVLGNVIQMPWAQWETLADFCWALGQDSQGLYDLPEVD